MPKRPRDAPRGDNKDDDRGKSASSAKKKKRSTKKDKRRKDSYGLKRAKQAKKKSEPKAQAEDKEGGATKDGKKKRRPVFVSLLPAPPLSSMAVADPSGLVDRCEQCAAAVAARWPRWLATSDLLTAVEVESGRKGCQSFLTLLLTLLDSMDVKGDDALRQRRRELIASVEQVGDFVDAKAKQAASKAEETGKPGEEEGQEGKQGGEEGQEGQEGSEGPEGQEGEEGPEGPEGQEQKKQKKKTMAPMSLEQYWETDEYEATQRIRHELDPDTGRMRLIKGSGEVLEEIVSRSRQQEINAAATRADGQSFMAMAAKRSREGAGPA